MLTPQSFQMYINALQLYTGALGFLFFTETYFYATFDALITDCSLGQWQRDGVT